MTRARRPFPRPPRAGFALLITITLVAFLVLVLVSLATLTRVETRIAANSQQLSHARQNALFSLNVALGRLQELAGPDQRVTATADIVAGRHDTKRHWTGVWDGAFDIDPAASSFQTPRGWLVSGSAATGPAGVSGALSAGSGNIVVRLVGDGTTDASVAGAAVSVESEPLRSVSIPGLPDDPAGHLTGRFAYWVGDEGVKARVNLIDPWANDSDADLRRHSFVGAQRIGIERVDTIEARWPVNAPVLGSVVSLNQLPLVQSASADRDALRAGIRARFHDLTAASFSVPADTARGGLKRDLTNWLRHPGAPGSPADGDLIHDPGAGNDPHGLPRWGLIRSYDATRATGAPLAPQSFENDPALTRQGVHPVVTYFRLGLNISCAGPGSPLVVHVFPLVVLWNPHNTDFDAADYELSLNFSDNLAQMRWLVDGAGGRALAHLSLNRVSLDHTGSARHWRFAVTAPVIPAGKSLVFSPGATAAYQSGRSTLVHAADTGESFTFTGTQPPPDADELEKNVFWDRGSWTGGNLYVTLRSAPANPDQDTYGNTLPPDTLHTVQLIGYGSPASNVTTTPVPLPAPATGNHIPEPVVSRRQLVSYASMTTGGDDRPRWIANQNLRAPRVVRPRIHGNINSAYFGGWNDGAQPNFDGEFASAGVAVTGSTANDFILSEFQPAGLPLFSLAQLQHANLSPLHLYPAHAVGNALADPSVALDAVIGSPDGAGTPVSGVSGEVRALYDLSHVLNRELWDRYFFSTAPAGISNADIASPDYHLPNARHVFSRAEALSADDLDGPDAFLRAASRLLVSGGFNINSTSFEAWRALLSSHNNLVTDGTNTHSFSRYANPAGAPNQTWAGHRILSDAQIDRLAHNIVAEVRRRGPFLSLADFVNRRLLDDPARNDGYKGALQAAIDTSDTETAADAGEPQLAPINNAAEFTTALVHSSTTRYDQQRFQGGPVRQAPHSSRLAFAPGYLTQADLLNVLGPVLAARSDTFRIRAYGEVVDPVTGDVTGRAWCEALVQRSAAYVDPAVAAWDAPAAGSDAERFGRRFEVVSFRWLDPDEI